jgi:hypothetical protein
VAQRVAEHVVRGRLFGPKRLLRVDLHGVSTFGAGDERALIRWEWVEGIDVERGSVVVRGSEASIVLPSGSFGLPPDELAELNRRLVGAWGSGLEAGWGGAIEVQRAWVSAGLALVDANTRWQRLALEQWSEMTRRTVLEPLQVLGRTAERLAEDGRSARGSTR